MDIRAKIKRGVSITLVVSMLAAMTVAAEYGRVKLITYDHAWEWIVGPPLLETTDGRPLL